MERIMIEDIGYGITSVEYNAAGMSAEEFKELLKTELDCLNPLVLIRPNRKQPAWARDAVVHQVTAFLGESWCAECCIAVENTKAKDCFRIVLRHPKSPYVKGETLSLEHFKQDRFQAEIEDQEQALAR